MKIIVTHNMTDFDGLGAMIATRKLHSEAQPVFVGRLQQSVRDFMALYRDEINIQRIGDIDLDNLNELIVVDTPNIESLGKLSEKIDLKQKKVILYDHHPHKKIEWVDIDNSQNTGSTTTILVHKINEKGLHFNPLEATICALGIYADTGFLSNNNTTVEDVSAVAILLKDGANLNIVNQFLSETLDKKQEKLLNNLLGSRETVEVDGLTLDLFYHQQEEYLTGLNRITEKIKTLYQTSSIFTIVKMGEKVEIVGRSSHNSVDIGKICSFLGGGGHQGAGAAQLKTSLEEAVKRLKKLIQARVQPEIKVKSIMSTPVRSISPDTTIAQAQEFMEKFGHNGVVVCKNDRIEGIFSRRDLDKVKGHDLMHAPVKAYMSSEVITIEADCSIMEAQRLMVKYNIGRLSVLEDGKMVGIVTRSDILSSYYEHETPHRYQNRYGSSLVKIRTEVSDIRTRLDYFPEHIRSLLQTAGKVSDDLDSRLYIIGGMVRDLLLERPNYDLDLDIEGDLQKFITKFSKYVDGEVNYNSEFQTANVKLSSGYNLDFATTRKEKYFPGGALPAVEKSNIFEDLFRRDFTINGLALAIYPEKWGQLFDFFQGRKDLYDSKLRVLHSFSFLDDPTRIIRGVRLILSLNFNFEEETKNLMQEALELGYYAELSRGRIYKEIKLVFDLDVWEKIAEIMSDVPFLKLINYNFVNKKTYKDELKRIKNWVKYFSKKDYLLEETVLKMAVFFVDMEKSKYEDLTLSKSEKELFNFNIDKYADKLSLDLSAVEIYRILHDLNTEKIILLLGKRDDFEIKNKIKYYLHELKDTELNIDGNNLIEMGLRPGPVIQKVLDRIWNAKLNGLITTEKEEREYAKKIINELKWSE